MEPSLRNTITRLKACSHGYCINGIGPLGAVCTNSSLRALVIIQQLHRLRTPEFNGFVKFRYYSQPLRLFLSRFPSLDLRAHTEINLNN